jgi:hypothetical protein
MHRIVDLDNECLAQNSVLNVIGYGAIDALFDARPLLTALVSFIFCCYSGREQINPSVIVKLHKSIELHFILRGIFKGRYNNENYGQEIISK